MTEEIIIDGVNVAECEFCKPNPLYKIEYACHCRGYIEDDGLHVHLSCEHNPNCYYKQLKRLEQERDELKNACEKCKLFDIEKTNRDLLEQIEELKQENRANEKQIELDVDHICNLNKQVDELKQENEQLKDTAIHFEMANDIKKQDIDSLREANEQLNNKLDEWEKELQSNEKIINRLIKESDKYKSALEEIREYINKCRNSHCDNNCEYWDNCKGNYNIDNILDKINEVLQCE